MENMRYKQRGLTLVELMVTLAVAIVLLAVGMPMFSSMVDNNRAATEANALSFALQLARSEAVKSGGLATLCPKDDPALANLDCGDENDWINGWMVHRGGAVASVDADDLLRSWAAPSNTEIVTAITGLTFSGTGVLDGAVATQTMTMRVIGCASGDPLQREITITPIGQVQMARGDCP